LPGDFFWPFVIVSPPGHIKSCQAHRIAIPPPFEVLFRARFAPSGPVTKDKELWLR
jgi:hypothetical protein